MALSASPTGGRRSWRPRPRSQRHACANRAWWRSCSGQRRPERRIGWQDRGTHGVRGAQRACQHGARGPARAGRGAGARRVLPRPHGACSPPGRGVALVGVGWPWVATAANRSPARPGASPARAAQHAWASPTI